MENTAIIKEVNLIKKNYSPLGCDNRQPHSTGKYIMFVTI